jgi:hypothetical protein
MLQMDDVWSQSASFMFTIWWVHHPAAAIGRKLDYVYSCASVDALNLHLPPQLQPCPPRPQLLQWQKSYHWHELFVGFYSSRSICIVTSLWLRGMLVFGFFSSLTVCDAPATTEVCVRVFLVVRDIVIPYCQMFGGDILHPCLVCTLFTPPKGSTQYIHALSQILPAFKF